MSLEKTLMKLYIEFSVHLSSLIKREKFILEQIQGRAMRVTRKTADLPYKRRWKELGLFSFTKQRPKDSMITLKIHQGNKNQEGKMTKVKDNIRTRTNGRKLAMNLFMLKNRRFLTIIGVSCCEQPSTGSNTSEAPSAYDVEDKGGLIQSCSLIFLFIPIV